MAMTANHSQVGSTPTLASKLKEVKLGFVYAGVGFAALCVAALTLLTYNDQRTQEARYLAMAAHDYATLRPALDKMCASYFRWAKMAHDRVEGMEKQCATR